MAQKVRAAGGIEYTGPLIPLVGNVTRWSSDADTLERASNLRDVLNSIIRIAVTEERKTKPHCVGLPSACELDLRDLDLDNPD